MKIAFLSSEVAPYAKTGGLADVTAALPKALVEAGHEVRTFLPFYREVGRKFPNLPLVRSGLSWAGLETSGGFSVRKDPTGGVPSYFIEKSDYFDRDGLYGNGVDDYPDNGERFAFFARSVLVALKAIDFIPEIIHAHDWQAATALAYLKFVYGLDPFFRNTKSVFTIHNLAYQGFFDQKILARIDLPERLFRMEDLEFYGRVNFLKAGILYASGVTTVSPQYAREIQTPEFGCGLEGLLRARSGALRGILNGIDDSIWDPSKDAGIAAPYGPNDLTGKAVCKKELLNLFNLTNETEDRPLIGVVSRLVGQKGLDILIKALGGLMAQGVRIVILGTGEPKIEEALKKAQRLFPSFFGLRIAYDDGLARKIFAGSDLFLIPSRYEPCGLTQMYSLKYGSVPVVRATGGLDDSVDEFRPETGLGTGFKFKNTEPETLLFVVQRALSVYRNKALWAKIIRNGMNRDFSWKRSASEYLRLYQEILDGCPERPIDPSLRTNRI